MSKLLSPLAGKVAVVTGASAGVGRAIGLALANEGVKVALGARRLEMLEETVKEIKSKGGEAIPVKTDVVDRQQVKNLVAEAEKVFGPVDFLINNAGYYYISMMTSLLEDSWDKTIDVNCKGVMNGIGAVLDGMVKRRSGHIINISSDSGKTADPGLTVYSGTKFFVEGMSQALRREVAEHGIKVTTIQLGYVDTEGMQASFEKKAVDKFMGESSKVKMLKDQEVASTIVYALSQPANVSIGEILVQPLDQLVT